MKKEFPEEGVTFIFPKSMEHIIVTNLGPPEHWPDDPQGIFKRTGFVMRFEFQDPPGEELAEFNAGFSIKVKFKQKHLDSAGGLSELKLGIHNDTGWIDKTQKSEKKKYSSSYRSKWRGYFKIKIKDWDDPAVSWGP